MKHNILATVLVVVEDVCLRSRSIPDRSLGWSDVQWSAWEIAWRYTNGQP